MSEGAGDKPKKPKRPDVGYKKPPKETQFKKGQSGNPKGRRKAPEASSELEALLLKETSVMKGGKRARATALDVYLQGHLKRAVEDKDRKAIKELFDTMKKYGASDRDPESIKVKGGVIRERMFVTMPE